MRRRLPFAPVRNLRRLGADRSGIALVEFAILLPVLLAMYLVGTQLTDAIACSRKVTIATRETADLITRYAQMSPDQVDTIMGAATQIMVPYTAEDASVRVTQLEVNGGGQVKVGWSRARNTDALTKNDHYDDLPADMKTPKSVYIMAEISFPWKPAVPFGLATSKTLSDRIFMLPRLSGSVTCDDC